MSQKTLIAVTAVGAGILAVTGVLLISALFFDDDERPPIIVENGSVVFSVAYEVNGSKGTWELTGTGIYRHRHDDTAPPRLLHTIGFGGNCTGTGWQHGPLRIETTGGTIMLNINGDHTRVQLAQGMTASAAGDVLTVADVTLTGVYTANGNSGCTFGSDGRIIIVQEK